MPSGTPFFIGLSNQLFGRRPVTALEEIARMKSRADALCLDGLEDLFGASIPGHLLAKRPGSRDRVYTTATTFWTFLSQVLDPGSCCVKAVARLGALRATNGLDTPSGGTGSYCEARVKLPMRALVKLCNHLVSRLCGASRGPREVVFDGTGISMPDTPSLQKKYPQPGSQKPGCGFPQLKLVGLFDLASGAWIASAKCHRKRHEARLFRNLYRHLRTGDTVVTDRGFCSYFTFVELSAMGVELVMRNHQMRKSDFRRGVRLGHRDHLIQWDKPPKPGWMKQSDYDTAPDFLVLRETGTTMGGNGFRTEEVILVTTYLGAGEKSSSELADIYLRRWRVELFFDDIKTTMGMDVLRTKSPAMVCRELVMHMIAYNLLRLAVARSGGLADRTSFKGTVDRVQVWMPHIVSENNARKRAQAVRQMLEAIREGKVPERLGRREPRVKKRRGKTYQLMTYPREEMMELPHRGKRRKTA
jgi:hypothetical protein